MLATNGKLLQLSVPNAKASCPASCAARVLGNGQPLAIDPPCRPSLSIRLVLPKRRFICGMTRPWQLAMYLYSSTMWPIYLALSPSAHSTRRTRSCWSWSWLLPPLDHHRDQGQCWVDFERVCKATPFSRLPLQSSDPFHILAQPAAPDVDFDGDSWHIPIIRGYNTKQIRFMLNAKLGRELESNKKH